VLGDAGRLARERARRSERVDYAGVRAIKMRVLHAAFDRFVEREWARKSARAQSLVSFMAREQSWLDDVALYSVLRESHGGWGWSTWPEDERERSPSATRRVRADSAPRLLEIAYVQWILDEQWTRAHREMRDLGVELMGDVPFVVGVESADVWSRASQFQIHLSLGAPPDDFSADGQDWGLPPYNWLAMEADDLTWIRRRTRRAAKLYDRFRLDHVVGYFRQWVRPKTPKARGRFDPESPDAQRARGLRVLGAMLDEVAMAHGSVKPPRVIAEDLGVIPPFARDVLRELALPGYRVLPWERDAALFRDPSAFPSASVASWSTHDTAPLDAWWDEFSPEDRAQLAKRAGVLPTYTEEERSLALLRDLYRAGSDLTLVLAQELLGDRGRINLPGSVGPQNWTWRLPKPIEDLEADPRITARFDAIRAILESAGR
jgi:4-alpha-glucanotransferase